MNEDKDSATMMSVFFHRLLGDTPPKDYSDTHDPTWRELRSFLRQAKARHRFVSSRELLELLETGENLDNVAHCSMDDGFASTLIAAEICAGLGVPLTVFVNSAPLWGYVPWFVRRVTAITAANGPVHFNGKTYDLPDFVAAHDLHEAVKQELYNLSHEERDARLTDILTAMGLPDPAATGLPEKFRFLAASELRDLVAAGMEIGAHGDTHCHLPGLAPQRLTEEVDGAKARLEDVLGNRVDFFSYPDGVHDAAARERVAAAGFKAAFSVTTAPTPVERYAIPRMVFGRCKKLLAA